MNCECKLAGWCERHKTNKTDRMVELCQQGGSYWEGWESGRLQKDDPSPPQKKTPGPGHHLKLILSEKGYKTKSGCGCNDKASRMNTWGPKKCRANIDEIVSWLEESAKKAGWLEKLAVTVPFVKDFAREEIKKIVIEAIERAEGELEDAKL